MPLLNINNIKVISPSPDNFILDVEIGGKHYNYIASGEHIYQNDKCVDSTLLNEHVAHSSIFKIGDTLVTAYSLFDMNDMGITTDDEDLDNLLLMPNANIEPCKREVSAIPFHGINSNAVYGYVKTDKNKSFGFPEYDENDNKFVMSRHNKTATGNPTPGTTDTLTLYHYRRYATNVSAVLGLGQQTDISSTEDGFDKMFVFDPTNDNNLKFSPYIKDWSEYQSNRNNGGVSNNFENSTLLARAILFPKQTLNNEYSTERQYVDSEVSAPFAQRRKYNFEDLDHFYSNGTHIILNHRDDSKFDFGTADDNTGIRGGTMVTSTYARRLGTDTGEELSKEHLSPEPPDGTNEIFELDNGEKEVPKIDYNRYGLMRYGESGISGVSGLYNQYSPELINRENETMSDTALMTSKHKTNIFNIEFKDDLWKNISDNLVPDESASDADISAYQEIRNNLKQSIKTNLFKLVEEIKPAHTELYKITFDNDN